MTLLEIKALAIALILSALGIAAWQFVAAERKIGAQACETAVVKATGAAQAAASATEAQWQAKYDDQQRAASAAVGSIQSRLDAAYRRLRVVPPSGGGMPQAAEVPASGSGGGLSGSIRLDPVQQAQVAFESARANYLRAKLGECQADLKTVGGS